MTVEDKFRNYIIGHAELGLDLAPAMAHFSEHLPEERVLAVAIEALGGQISPPPLVVHGAAKEG